ncbi:hypothetical protein BJV82DRAFT_668746 [Fennellomyces sp. T-0311]|nr:hypothetical protein BJV82DRAFT_668746 [Fennellomyces sp. T-0311]
MTKMTNSVKLITYKEGEDPEYWLELMERSNTGAEWDDKSKLNDVPFHLGRKEAFVERYDDSRVGRKPALRQLLKIKRHSNEKLRGYCDRFDDLRMRYERQYKKETGKDSKLSELELCNIFVHGLGDKSMRVYVDQKNPKTVKEAKKLAMFYRNRYVSSDEDKSASSSESSSDDREIRKLRKKLAKFRA